MSTQWWQWLIWNPKAMGVLRSAEASLEADMIRWIGWPEADKNRATALMVELLAKVIPGYRLDFQFYTQFVAFVGKHDTDTLTELAQRLNGMARAAEGSDEPLRMVADTLKAYVAMFALTSRSAAFRRRRAEIYGMQSRSINDVVQTYLAVKLNDMISRYEPA